MKKEEKMFATINETAKLTGLSRAYIRQLCKTGKAPCLRIGGGRNAVYKIHFQRFVEMIGEMSEVKP